MPLLSRFRPALHAILAVLALLACQALATPLPLIPAPQSAVQGEGQFVLRPNMTIGAQDPEARATAQQFIDLLRSSGGPSLKLASERSTADAPIQFKIEAGSSGNEHYALQVTPQQIQVSAAHVAGLFYGAMSLWQLIPANTHQPSIAINAVSIIDQPRLPWRGLMLDSARHFQSVDEIKRLLDAMAVHKLNVFHWHLTDDQGWRVQIDQYPLLTEVGGCRMPLGDTGAQSDDPLIQECAFYTKDQIRAIVHYAAERHITIVPEIDIPGHATAAIAAYPQLGVDTPQLRVSNWGGVHGNLFNADEATMHFLENVLGEVAQMFPGPFVHIGGDEAIKDSWKTSAHMQARIRQLGLKDEDALQGWMINRLGTYLAAHGKRLIGWDEILQGGDLPANAAVMSWRGTDGGIAAARTGHDVVMTPSSDLYLDYLQTASPTEPPGRPTLIPLQKVYAFEPVPAALEADQREHIIGVQANVWTGYITNFERVEHAVFSRIAALSEIAWSAPEKRNLDDFKTRLPYLLEHYRALRINYAMTPFQVLYASDADANRQHATVTLSDPMDYQDIRYTTDGSTPSATSARYTAPLSVALPSKLQAAVFFDGKPLAPATTLSLTQQSLRSRSTAQLSMCSNGLTLRLEDDGPQQEPRAIYDVDILNPCWQWKQAALNNIGSIRVHAGRIPYSFHLAQQEHLRTFRKAKSAYGELEVHDGCDGVLLASVPLPQAPDEDGFITLDAPLKHTPSQSNMCVFFTGDTRPNMWVLDRVTLIPLSSHADTPSP